MERTAESERTGTFRQVRLVAGPAAKSDVSNCILFTFVQQNVGRVVIILASLQAAGIVRSSSHNKMQWSTMDSHVGRQGLFCSTHLQASS